MSKLNTTKKVYLGVAVSSPDNIFDYHPSINDISNSQINFFTNANSAIYNKVREVYPTSKDAPREGCVIHYLEIDIPKDIYKKFVIRDRFGYRDMVSFGIDLSHVVGLQLTHRMQPYYPFEYSSEHPSHDNTAYVYVDELLHNGRYTVSDAQHKYTLMPTTYRAYKLPDSKVYKKSADGTLTEYTSEYEDDNDEL